MLKENLQSLKNLLKKTDEMSSFELYKLKPSEKDDPPGKMYLEQAKGHLKNVVTELIKTLNGNEVLMLTWPEPGVCWATIDKDGYMTCTESDCEGTWGGATNLQEYFEHIKTLNDARELYRKLSKPPICDVSSGILKFKEYRKLS